MAKTRMTVIVVETDSDAAVTSTLRTMVEALSAPSGDAGAAPARRGRGSKRGLPSTDREEQPDLREIEQTSELVNA